MGSRSRNRKLYTLIQRNPGARHDLAFVTLPRRGVAAAEAAIHAPEKVRRMIRSGIGVKL